MALRQDIAEDIIERLRFFASDRIAPYVRNIYVDYARYRGGPPVDDCDVVLHSLVHHLHHFIGLQKLIFAEELELRSDDFILPPSASIPIIRLTEYSGPRTLLPLLSDEPTLRCLELFNLDEPGFDDAVHLMAALTSRGVTSQLTMLTITIDCLTEDVFKTVFSISPRLIYLRMIVKNNFFSDLPGLLVSQSRNLHVESTVNC
jgi:hypothetical protein